MLRFGKYRKGRRWKTSQRVRVYVCVDGIARCEPEAWNKGLENLSRLASSEASAPWGAQRARRSDGVDHHSLGGGGVGTVLEYRFDGIEGIPKDAVRSRLLAQPEHTAHTNY